LEFLIFFGLVIAAWYFFSKKVKGQLGTSPQARRKSTTASGSKKPQDGLTFEREGKLPETDSEGNVIVRLAAGSQIQFEVRVRADEAATRYLLGKPKDDEVARSVRARVLVSEQSEIVEVKTPDGNEIGDVLYSETKNALQVFGMLESELKKLSKGLSGNRLVFDVSLRVEGEWQEDSEEASGWFGDVYSATIKIKDPAGIDIL
jgi:hypothetical protein